MRRSKAEVLEWEGHWAVPAALAALAGTVLIIAGFVIIQAAVGNGPNYEGLRKAHDAGLSVTLSGGLDVVGFLLLTAPLLFQFRAAQARSDRVRGQMVGLVVIAPLFLAVSGALLTAGANEAADHFVTGKARSTLSVKGAAEACRSERREKGVKSFAKDFPAGNGGPRTSLETCEAQKIEESKASNSFSEASLFSAGGYIGLAGDLGLAGALFYSCLWAMRTGLLTRFWGSLGMAMGVAAVLGLTQFTLIWFVYFALLALGRVRGGRPPAWAAGEAIPWPSPGEKAGKALERGDST